MCVVWARGFQIWNLFKSLWFNVWKWTANNFASVYNGNWGIVSARSLIRPRPQGWGTGECVLQLPPRTHLDGESFFLLVACYFHFNFDSYRNDFLKIILRKTHQSKGKSWQPLYSPSLFPLPIIRFPISNPLGSSAQETLAHKLIGWCRFLCRLCPPTPDRYPL